MASFHSLLSAGFAVALLFCSLPAEARFGKRTDSTESNSKDTRPHEASPGRSPGSSGDSHPPPHPATAIEPRSPPRAETEEERRERKRRELRAARDDKYANRSTAEDGSSTYLSPTALSGVSSRPSGEVATGVIPPSPHDFHRQSLWGRSRASGEEVPLDLRMGMTGGPLGGGVGLDGVITLEVGHLGVAAKLTGLDLPAEDGSGGSDQITLVQLHATFAAVALDRLRLRAEAGASLARAPDVSFTGLSLGTSMEVCLWGPFDLEARVQVTPFPYRQFDALAGLVVNVRPLEMRAGYRGLILDDQGLVDDVRHVDRFRGPYFGLSLGF